MATEKQSLGPGEDAIVRSSSADDTGSGSGQDSFPDEKKTATVALKSEDSQDDSLPPNYAADVESTTDEAIHHPANKDDILTRTIHLEDDPTLNALTFRTWFLGMWLLL